MAAVNVCLEIEQGAKWYKRFVRRDKASNDPIDVTGLEARMHVRKEKTDDDILLTLSSLGDPDDDGTITLGGVEGTIELEIGAATTATLEFSRAVYDLELYDPNDLDNVIRVIEGDFRVDLNVTR